MNAALNSLSTGIEDSSLFKIQAIVDQVLVLQKYLHIRPK